MTTGYLMLMIGCVGLAGTLIWIFADAAKKPDRAPTDATERIIKADVPIYKSTTSIKYNKDGGNIIPKSENPLKLKDETEPIYRGKTSTDMMTKTAKFCPKCGTQNKTGGKFCRKCGNRL